MEFYSFSKQHGRNITKYDSNFIMSRLAITETKAFISCMYLEENGIIGYHEATVNQILYVVQGECEVCNEQKQYKTLRVGDAVFWEKGEWHETKTSKGLTAIVIEGETLSPNYLTKLKKLTMSQEIVNAVQANLASIIYFDESDYLRERTSNMNLLLQFIARLESLYVSVDNDEQYKSASMLGYLYRVAGADDGQQLTKAEQYFKECLTYAKNQEDVAKEITTLIRLGEVYKYGSRYDEACTLFHEAITKCVKENDTRQLDFAHQHLGKCFMEMGKFAQAESQLQTALKLREKKENESLINSTVKALELLAKLERDVR